MKYFCSYLEVIYKLAISLTLADSWELVPVEKPTVMLPMINIMGGKQFPKIFQKKSGWEKSKNDQRKTDKFGGEGASYDIKEGIASG